MLHRIHWRKCAGRLLWILIALHLVRIREWPRNTHRLLSLLWRELLGLVLLLLLWWSISHVLLVIRHRLFGLYRLQVRGTRAAILSIVILLDRLCLGLWRWLKSYHRLGCWLLMLLRLLVARLLRHNLLDWLNIRNLLVLSLKRHWNKVTAGLGKGRDWLSDGLSRWRHSDL